MPPLNKKTTSLFITVLMIGTFAAVYFIAPFFSNRDFKGNLKNIDGNIMIVNGRFPSATGTNFFNIKVIVNKNTAIHRIGLKIPTVSGTFNADNLPREESQADLATLQADAKTAALGMEIALKKVFYRPGYFTARNIIYRVPIFAVPR